MSSSTPASDPAAPGEVGSPIADRAGPSRRWGETISAGLLALLALVLLTSTINDYGMTWDEGFTVEREERLREWFGRVLGGSRFAYRAWSPFFSKLERRADYVRSAGMAADSPWSRESLRFYWQFAREEPNGHPPFYALLGLAGWAVSHPFLPPPGSYRFGPVALFALTIGVVYGLLARHYGRGAGLLAALGLLTMPRVFAHAHFASYDVPTLCLWFLAVSAFWKAVEPAEEGIRPRAWVWTVAFGLALGASMATKLTGWFVPFPILVWVIWYRDLRGVRTLVLGSLMAALVLYALNPTWWAEPLTGLRVFLEANLTRHRLLPIPTLFLGEIYGFSLPWYNTIVWTAVVVPPMTLGLALLGIGRVLSGRLRDRLGAMLLAHWVFLMVLRALPNAPGHDGARLFLPAFVFLACLSGIGLTVVGAGLGRIFAPRVARGLTVLVLAGSLGAGAWSTWRYHPLQLSYYNVLIGGLSGATRAGMEPTYYWEAFTPDAREWINAHTDEGRLVAFVFPAVTFEYLHRWGLLRPSPVAAVTHSPQWFVVMNRPGHLLAFPNTIGQMLLDHSRPAFLKTLDVAPEVPLLAIYPGEEAMAAYLLQQRATQEPDDQ